MTFLLVFQGGHFYLYLTVNNKNKYSDGNQNSSDNQLQNHFRGEASQTPAKTETENFGRCSEGLTL